MQDGKINCQIESEVNITQAISIEVISIQAISIQAISTQAISTRAISIQATIQIQYQTNLGSCCQILRRQLSSKTT